MAGLARALQIAWVCWRFGLHEMLLARQPRPWLRGLGRLLSLGRHWRDSDSGSEGQRLRQALERLGPLFVKLGQVLSTRRDMLPSAIADELAKLQDRVPPFPSEQAVATIERAFGRPLQQIFAEFAPQPVASASIAQVHLARLHEASDGQEEVAVKVLRPGMGPIIARDLRLMHALAAFAQWLSPEAKRLKPRAVVAEFDQYLHDELDLVREAAHASQLRRNMAGLDLVLIPQMVWPLCHPEVIVMERMVGLPINQHAALRAAGVDFKRLARDGVTIFFTQVFRDGFFHADMHPGNIMVSTAPQTLGRYISLDFGIVGALSEYDKNYLAQNFVAFFRRDYRRIAELHIESGWVPAATRVPDLEGAVRAVCEPYFDRPLKDISLGMVLLRLFQASRRFSVEIQPQLVLLQKTLLNIEGLGRELDPELDLWSTAKPFMERWMDEQIGPRGVLAQLRRHAPRYANTLPELPLLLHSYLSQRGDTAQQTRALLAELQHTNRLLQAVLGSALGFLLGLAVVLILMRFWFR